MIQHRSHFLKIYQIGSEESAIYWVVDASGLLRESYPKTLVYCNSMSDVSYLYNHVFKELENCTYLVEMFYSEIMRTKQCK